MKNKNKSANKNNFYYVVGGEGITELPSSLCELASKLFCPKFFSKQKKDIDYFDRDALPEDIINSYKAIPNSLLLFETEQDALVYSLSKIKYYGTFMQREVLPIYKVQLLSEKPVEMKKSEIDINLLTENKSRRATVEFTHIDKEMIQPIWGKLKTAGRHVKFIEDKAVDLTEINFSNKKFELRYKQ